MIGTSSSRHSKLRPPRHMSQRDLQKLMSSRKVASLHDLGFKYTSEECNFGQFVSSCQ